MTTEFRAWVHHGLMGKLITFCRVSFHKSIVVIFLHRKTSTRGDVLLQVCLHVCRQSITNGLKYKFINEKKTEGLSLDRRLYTDE